MGIRCGNKRCSAFGKCNFKSNIECDFFILEDSNEEKTKNRKKQYFRKTEDGEQQAVIEYCDLADIPIVHIPNEGKRTAFYAAKLKAVGLKKGFPDLFIPKAKKGFHGLFIELKRDKHSYPTKEQLGWICYLNRAGYKATISYGATAAIKEIQEYFKE